MKKEISMGKHLILEVYDVSFEILNDVSTLLNVLQQGIEHSKMTILNVFLINSLHMELQLYLHLKKVTYHYILFQNFSLFLQMLILVVMEIRKLL